MDFNKAGDAQAVKGADYVPPIAGRVLQLDADFICYHATDLEKTLGECFDTLKDLILHKKSVARAVFCNAHITLAEKSGRDRLYADYQVQRKGANLEVKARVRELRELLATYVHPSNAFAVVPSRWREADDTMCIYQNQDIENSVIMSGDKDLWMVKGMHCSLEGKFYNVEGFGECEYKEVGNVKPKLIGTGTCWFWHQMLMGDSADNIKGLPKLTVAAADMYFPLKKKNPKRNPLACGEAKAVELMKGVKSDKEALILVYRLYKGWFKDNATKYFMQNAYCLWMQRDWDLHEDLIRFFTETGIHLRFTKEQLKILEEFANEVQLSS